MKRKDIKSALEEINIGIESTPDDKANYSALLNLVETLANDLANARATIQQLKDENNKLKGEQGKPNIRKQKNKDDDANSGNHSSENNRKQAKKSKKKKRKKKGNIAIDRQIICTVDKDNLPADIEFKGYEPTVIQDIIIKTDNIEFRREIYYSPSLTPIFTGTISARKAPKQ